MKIKNFSLDDRRITQAIKAAESGDYDEAISIYSELIRHHNVSELYNQRAIAYTGKKEYQNALSDLTTAIKLRSNDPDCYLNRGNAFLRLKNYDSALADYQIASSLSPNNPIVLNSRGLTKFKMGDTEGAIEDFWAAVGIDNNYLSPLYNLGLVCKSMDKIDEARDFLNRALSIDPTDSESLKLLSTLDQG